MSLATVLVVEDDASLREALCDTLELAGYTVKGVSDGNSALKMVEEQSISMVVSDVHMRPVDGNALLQKLKQRDPNLPVVLMTAYGSVEKAVEAMRQGADDYLVKPFDAEVLVNMVSRYISNVEISSDIVAEDPRSIELLALAERVAASEATVIISGESGTGKEVVARHIHRCSNRHDQPFVAINCAAIPENMLEAVLFGYEKGAFTGAYQASTGKFEQAQGGTLLLDEISEMDLGLQAKLLRVIQEREVERLGGKKAIPLDVRILATTNRNLREEVTKGRFREDLFYRLNVFPIHVLPLRSRSHDIIPLSKFIVSRHWKKQGVSPRLTEAAANKLMTHSWPGNVRELDNVIQRAIILMAGCDIEAKYIHFEPDACIPEGVLVNDDPCQSKLLTDGVKDIERNIILDALREYENRKDVAEKLGISPRTLRYKLAKLRDQGIQIPGE
ncbi:MAG: sigma-54-dependent Fis family transcriptional regulator [Gammaproteobacteria bacterium]|nr:sigma-54-dependent Fis family transcriptional regulator [Gammaproteobacteria bacterium]